MLRGKFVSARHSVSPVISEYQRRLAVQLQSRLKKLERLTRRAAVFLSHAHRDRQIAQRIHDALRRHDFGVWFDEKVAAGEQWADAIHSAIDEGATRGFVLLLLSPNSEVGRERTQRKAG